MSDQPRSPYVLEYENDLASFFNKPALPAAAKTLALFCSIPYYIRPELLSWFNEYLLGNRFDDIETEVLRAPFIYRERGRYYRMERRVRETLRAWLRAEGGSHIERNVAITLLRYVETAQQEDEDDGFWPHYREAQRRAAHAVLNPRLIAEDIAQRLKEWQTKSYQSEEDHLRSINFYAIVAEEATVDLQRLGGGIRLIQFVRKCADLAQGREVNLSTTDALNGVRLFNVELLPLKPLLLGDEQRLEREMRSSGFIVSTQRISFPRRANRVAWSADGSRLITAGQDNLLRTWDLSIGEQDTPEDFHLTEDVQRRRHASGLRLAASASGDLLAAVLPNRPDTLQVRSIEGDERILWEVKLFDNPIHVMAWSPADDLAAAASDEYTLYVLDGRSGGILRTLSVDAPVSALAFSPDGRYLAVGTLNNPQPHIQIWDVRAENLVQTLRGHIGGITSLVWWPQNDHLIASGSSDCTIRVWDWHSGQAVSSLERHTRSVTHLSVSHDGSVLASASPDESVCLWSRTRDFELMYVLNRPESSYDPCEIAFHPHRPLLAMVEENVFVSVMLLNLEALHDEHMPDSSAYYYSTAKVVVVGDGGVGKTALCHALQGEEFKPRFGTHSVNMWRLDAPRGEYRGKPVHREIFLWDLAGQEDYRLIHQLYMTNVSAALLVFAQNATHNPFWGLERWNHSLRQVEARDRSTDAQSSKAPTLRKFLVQARADMIGSGVAMEEIEARLQQLGCESFHVTSAKEGIGIEELHQALVQGIDWQRITQNVSTILFETITKFLNWVQESPDIQLVPSKRLYQMFLERYPNAPLGARLWRQFETCLTFLEARQFLRRFDFGGLVLLRPELLYFYAASMIDSARQTDLRTFGQVPVSAIVQGDVYIPDDRRINNGEEHRWMLLATMQDLLRFEVAMVDEDEGMLIFPSHFATGPDHPFQHAGYDEVFFTFSGAVINLYAALIVRLSRTNLFHLNRLAYHQAQFVAEEGGMCGITLEDAGDSARLLVYFDEQVNTLTRYTFDQFIRTYLKRQTVGGDVTRTPVYYCANPDCPSEERVRFDPEMVNRRFQMRKRNIRCPICEELTELAESPISDVMLQSLKQRVAQMNQQADRQRDRQAVETIFRAKQALNIYDVYFEASPADAQRIQGLVDDLRTFGVYTLAEPRPNADDIAEAVKAVVFFVSEHELDEQLIEAWRARIRRYLAHGLTVVLALYRTQSFPGDLLRDFANDVEIIYFLDDLKDRDRLSELVRFTSGHKQG